MKKEIPEQAIYLARYGEAAWNRKYASYVERDYSNILAGSYWVSGHAQIDIAVTVGEKVCFPWVTVFRDIKTSKWLGWLLHFESPNSDHIFQSFYYAVLAFGLPDHVLIDNGKDYRCKNFALDKNKSMLAQLGIEVHYALPYNPQTKPVERDFLKIKNLLSKHFVGYRGGNVVERPEKLKKEIKEGKLLTFDEFKPLFDDFIVNVLNKLPSKGKVLKGRCPDEVFAAEFQVKKTVTKDALKLLCMRTSKTFTIGRNGIFDSALQVTYWADWMVAHKGKKVYLRRDDKAYQEAWVFDAKTDEFIDKAE